MSSDETLMGSLQGVIKEFASQVGETVRSLERQVDQLNQRLDSLEQRLSTLESVPAQQDITDEPRSEPQPQAQLTSKGVKRKPKDSLADALSWIDS